MSETAIDIAWDRPTVAEIKATGAIGVLRYFSTDSTKNLTAAEVAEYHAAGLATGDVWETTTGRATQGYQAGVDDAGLAEAQRKADGLPPNQVVYFAVDEDTDWASVEPYFRGASDVLGKQRVGVYGGLRVIEGAYAAGYRYLWQTLAWSGGRRSAHAVLYQNGATVLGGAADINDILAADWGQYPSPSEVDMDATQNQMLVDIHNALAVQGWGFRNAQEDAAALKASGGKAHSLDAWGKVSTTLGNTNQLLAQVAALSAVVAQLAKGGSLTAEQATAAAQAGAAAALAEAEAAAKRVVDALQPPAPAKP